MSAGLLVAAVVLAWLAALAGIVAPSGAALYTVALVGFGVVMELRRINRAHVDAERGDL